MKDLKLLECMAVSSAKIQSIYALFLEKSKETPTLEDFSKKIMEIQNKYLSPSSVSSLEKLKKLQKVLKEKNLDGFIFSTTDEYMNEYVPMYAQRLPYLTNFSGSFAICMILQSKAVVFVDGRYTIQARNQIDNSAFDILNLSMENITNWLKTNLVAKSSVALDLCTTSNTEYSRYKEIIESIGSSIYNISTHLVDTIWDNQPPLPISKAFFHENKYSGKSSSEKITIITERIKTSKLNYYLVTAVDSIAWLLNVRGEDVQCNPLVLSKLIIEENGRIYWFVNNNKITTILEKQLPNNLEIYEENDLESFVKDKLKNKVVGISPNSPAYYHFFMENICKEIHKLEDFCYLEKCKKNPTEIKSTLNAHIRDGAKLTKLIYKLNKNPTLYCEISIDKELNSLREKDPLFAGQPSFYSIIGVDDNGAIIHYRASEITNKKLTDNSYVLIDCGAQYYDGTTDVTRTLSFKKTEDIFKKCYTLVLKGHIALASLPFKEGLGGNALDVTARQFLWEEGLDYAHGTGHGVGCFLGVHEGPISISQGKAVVLEKGMIISNEPGFYEEGKYGIRLENLYVVEASDKLGFLRLKSLTLVPFDNKNIDFSLFTEKEKIWLNNYHNEVFATLSPLLEEEERIWLKEYIKI